MLETQRCPELFSYLQGVADSAPRMGHFVLTGSQQFGLLADISQSLAGRVALTPLLPFSYTELAAAGRAPATLDTLLGAGLYPPIHDRDLEPGRWYANYVQTYLERDVRPLVNVRDLSTFQRFLRLCAGRTGQLLNHSTLADDVGVARNTVRAWVRQMPREVHAATGRGVEEVARTPRRCYRRLGRNCDPRAALAWQVLPHSLERH